MRWLAPVLVLLLARTAAAAPDLVDMKIEAVPVVVAISDEPDDARHTIQGKVTRVQPLGDNVFRIIVGRGPKKGSFQVGLPPAFSLPIRIGDTIRAELWLDGTKLHARVTDAKGAPLVFMNELPAGWTMTIGAATGRPPRGPRTQHVVKLTAPARVAKTFEGWVRGLIDGATYRVYGEAARIDVKVANDMGLKPTWTQSIWSGLVRERDTAPPTPR